MARGLTQRFVDDQARRNADRVLAESALAGERRVAWARLAMLLLIGVAPEGRIAFDDPLRAAVVAVYSLLAVGAVVGLRYAKPNARQQMIAPLFSTLVDFAFLTFNAVRDHQTVGHLWPEMGAATFALLIAFSVARYGARHVIYSTGVACATYIGLAIVYDAWSTTSVSFVVGVFVALGLVIGLTNRSMHKTFADLRRRDNLSRFLPPQIVDRLLAHGEAALRPVQTEVTVLFSDIRDFTRMSEHLEPREVLAFLDDYFGHMAHVVKARGGLVNKFLGDGLLAVWNVPEPDADHAAQALRAALDMRQVVVELNQARAAAGKPEIKIGIGLHSGTVAAGMLGGADQCEYTVIGDAVNLASRIEGLTKTLGVDILVSEATWQRVSDRFAGERVAEEQVKGREQQVVVYALAGVL